MGLLVAAAYAEKKINLEDIEKDNLRAEGKAKVESIRTDETKYTIKPNIYQQQYQSQYSGLDAHSQPYVPGQQLQNLKYSVRYLIDLLIKTLFQSMIKYFLFSLVLYSWKHLKYKVLYTLRYKVFYKFFMRKNIKLIHLIFKL